MGDSFSQNLSAEEELLSLVNTLVKPKAPEEKAAEGEAMPERVPAGEGDEEFQRLRQLLMGREIQELEELRGCFGDHQKRVTFISQVITEAILLRAKKDKGLESALAPTVEHIVRNSVRRNPAELADSLFPVIGPAIRRSIAAAIKSMFQDFSRTLEMSFSPKGLRWRLEALRTGRPFAEVLLLHTLEYQVEQLFLVKSDSGELLDHLVAEGALAHDGEQVAAMFTAVQQFVNDSFAQGGLNTLEFGDVEVLVQRSGPAYIACVVRGQIPSHLRADLQEALELVVMEYAEEIENFTGDSSVFIPSRKHVEGLITAKYKTNETVSLGARLLPYLLLLLIIAGLGFFLYKNNEMERLAARVYAETTGIGFLPVRVEPHLLKNWRLIYLRDDLSDDPAAALEKLGLDPGRLDIRYFPYLSQDTAIVERRAEKILGDKPPGLGLAFDDDDNTINLSGRAPLIWLIAAYERLLSVSGVEAVLAHSVSDDRENVRASITREGAISFEGEANGPWIAQMKEKALATGFTAVDLGRLRDPEAEVLAQRRAEAEAELNRLVRRVNATVIYFPLNSDSPVPEDLPKLQTAVADLVILEKLAANLEMSISLTIYGHADATGSARRNYELSQERTKTLAAMLYAQGSRIPINNYGLGSNFAHEEGYGASDQSSRKIELHVNLTSNL